MPNLDGTGPEGKGPKTGRKQGQCASNEDIYTTNKRQRKRQNLRRNTSEKFNLKRERLANHTK